MSKATLRKALAAHKAREEATVASERISRRTVNNYPATHNPYLAHAPQTGCEPVCAEGHGKAVA